MIGTEERVDNRRQRLGIDQVDRREHLVVAHIHTLTDGAGHTGQADAELGLQLLTHSTDTTVAQVVDIVDFGLAAQQLDQIFDDGDDVFLSQDFDIFGDVEVKLAVDAVTADQTQVISLVREEQLLDDATGRLFIGRLSVTQLAINIFDSFLLGVAGVFFQSLKNDRIVRDSVILVAFRLAMEQDGLHATVNNLLDMFFLKGNITLDDDLVTFDGHALASVLVDEVFIVSMQYASGELATQHALQASFGNLHFFGEVKDIKDVLVTFVTNGTKQSRDGQFLLTVDVSIHDIVDVGRKLHPRTLERNDTGRIQHSAVGMLALAEENTGGTVQL